MTKKSQEIYNNNKSIKNSIINEPSPGDTVIRLENLSPTNGQTLDGPSRGEPIVVSGTVFTSRVSFERVTVKIGDAQYTSRLRTWSFTIPINEIRMKPESMIKGPLRIEVSAIGVALRGEPTDGDATIEVNITDIIKPNLTPIAEPANNSPFSIRRDGYDLTIKGKVVEYLGLRNPIVEWTFGNKTWPLTAQLSQRNDSFEYEWSLNLHVMPQMLGTHTIKVKCSDKADNISETRVLNFTVFDKIAPDYSIIEPKRIEGQDRILIQGSNTGTATVKLRGIATDPNSGMEKVSWALDGSQPIDAVTEDNWQNWRAEVPITGFGPHTVKITFRDKAGNETSELLRLQIQSTFKPQSIEELLSNRSYLEKLLYFAHDHISETKTASGAPEVGAVTVDVLNSVFHQPFDKLIFDPYSRWMNQSTTQVGISIQILRKYMSNTSRLLGHWKLDEVDPATTANDVSGLNNHGRLVSLPQAGLIAHWKFDEVSGNMTADATGFGSMGTLNGPTWSSDGKIGRSISFGENNYVQITNMSHALQDIGIANSDFSVTFWMKLRQSATTGWRSVIHKGLGDFEAAFSVLLYPDNRIHFRISTINGPNETGDSNSSIPIDTWTHIAYVKSGNTLRLYINGDLSLGSEIQLGSPSTNRPGPIYIGKDPFHSKGVNALIDDARIHGIALSKSELAAMIELPPKGPSWSSEGKIGRSISFDSVDDCVQVNNTPTLEVGKNGADFSLTFWIRLNEGSAGKWRCIMHKGNSRDSERTFGLWLHPENNKIHYRISTTGSAAEDKNAGGDSTGLIIVDKWTHVAYVKFKNKLKLYINGEFDSQVILRFPSEHNTGPIYFGRDPWFYGIKGQLDDIRIYDAAIPAGAISRIISDSPLKLDESQYLLAAYETILNRIGTSYEEIRLLRGAEDSVRKAVAARLGIDLSDTSPDQLDTLYIEVGKIDEPLLEKLFGLMNTSRDPWQPITKPQLLVWQLDHLDNQWTREDHIDFQPNKSLQSPSLPIIIDPDIIGEKNIVNVTPGNPAFDIWKSRSSRINAWLRDLDNKQRTATTSTTPSSQLGGLRKIVDDTLGNLIPTASYPLCKDVQGQPLKPLDFLQCLFILGKQGNDIDPALSGMYLNASSFLYIIRIKELAQKNLVTDEEWKNIYDILVQVLKYKAIYLGNLPLGSLAWKAEEQQKNIILSPKLFRIASASTVISKWRTNTEIVQKWQNILQSRTELKSSIEQAFQENIQSTEELTLPILRDVLIGAVKLEWDRNPFNTLDNTAERLTRELLVDIVAGRSSSQKTTYIMQATETLQSILFSVRSQSFEPKHPAHSWVIAAFDMLQDKIKESNPKEEYGEKDFDIEWKWMGSYAAWRSATLSFFYPENALYPHLRPKEEQSVAFKNLVKDSNKKTFLTIKDASDLASGFISGVKSDSIDRPKGLPDDFKITAEDQTVLELQKLKTQCIQMSASNRNDPNPMKLNCIKEIFYFVPLYLALQLQKSGQYIAALDWYQLVYAYNLPINERKIYGGLLLDDPRRGNNLGDEVDWLLNWLNPHKVAIKKRSNAYARFTIMSLILCLIEVANTEFTKYSTESVNRARLLYLTARKLLLLPDLKPIVATDPNDIVIPNPVIDALKPSLEANLSKLRQGRNISGIKRRIDNYMPVDLTENGIAQSTTGSGNLLIDDFDVLRPTPFRYGILIERSKQLVNIAQQMESSYLLSLEKIDAENYNLIKAGHDINLAQANRDLQRLRVVEAKNGIDLAQKQQDRVIVQQATYQNWINTGLSKVEKTIIQNYKDARNAKIRAEEIAANAQIAQNLFSMFNPWTVPGTIVSTMIGSEATDFTKHAIEAEHAAQINSVYASYEQRKAEWKFQLNLADKDIAISKQQIVLAQDREAIVSQEEHIANIQLSQARDVAEFLVTKFTNVELYEWMSRILVSVYRYFLQQAASVAKLAESQLAFERQEKPSNFILADYWEPPSDIITAEGTDRRGLTGSARLLQDIYRLDQYAFETTKRYLNLIQSFSLSQLNPLEFQSFRENGILRFATPMKLFDQSFPGHYMRLIRRVRVSISALIPPVQGIRATLASSGISRVITRNRENIFQTTIIRQDPELVALTSPTNATGVFDLDLQSELRSPFDSSGVDTAWELKMPKAANQFDYNTISDVYFTVEYSSLDSFDYRQQVIRTMDPNISGDITFSFRDQFPDEWYRIQNPEEEILEEGQTGNTNTDTNDYKPLVTRFKITREDFATNILNIQTENVLVYISRKEGQRFELPVRLAYNRTTVRTDEATSMDGILSTRRDMWRTLKGQMPFSPMGDWELSFRSDNADKYNEILTRFKNGDVTDILFVLTYTARGPEWPI